VVRQAGCWQCSVQTAPAAPLTDQCPGFAGKGQLTPVSHRLLGARCRFRATAAAPALIPLLTLRGQDAFTSLPGSLTVWLGSPEAASPTKQQTAGVTCDSTITLELQLDGGSTRRMWTAVASNSLASFQVSSAGGQEEQRAHLCTCATAMAVAAAG